MFGEGDMKMGLEKNPPGPHAGCKAQLRSGAGATPPLPRSHLDPWAYAQLRDGGRRGLASSAACPSPLPALRRGW